MTDRDALLSIDDAAAIGFKIVEMADRLNGVDTIVPGLRAKWGFEVDGVHYDVIVTRSKDDL